MNNKTQLAKENASGKGVFLNNALSFIVYFWQAIANNIP